ncbi:hypothetical protein [Pseudomonas farris]
MLGVYDLRHVGFLGAQPPSVKGLRPIELTDGEQGLVEFCGVSVDINVDCAAVFASKPAPTGSASTPDRIPVI